MKPTTKFYLINVNYLDTNLDNTLGFSSKENQFNWFTNPPRIVRTVVDNVYHRKNQPIKVGFLIDDLENCNYCIVDNGTRKWYYFIISKEYINHGMTQLNLELDVFQTYLFDMSFNESFIERMHLNYATLVDEELQVGDYFEFSRNDIADLSNGTVIISATDPLGYVKSRRPSLGVGGGGSTDNGTGGSTGGDPTKGICSASMLRVVKQYEGFAPNPYYGGTETFRTYGYGITEKYKPTYFNMLGSPPCTEKTASTVLSEMIIKDFGVPLANQMKVDKVDLSRIKPRHFDVFCGQSMNTGLGSLSSGKGVVGGSPYQAFINGKSETEVAELMKTWAIMKGTVFEKGLRARREHESNIFLTGNYGFKSIGIRGGGTVTDNNGHGFIPSIHGDIYGGNSSNRGTFKNDLGTFILPCDGRVSSLYGWRKLNGVDDFHLGLDIANVTGTQIFAMHDGVVDVATYHTSYGNYVDILRNDGIVSRYAHLSSFKVTKGQSVKGGDIIAHMGNTGNSFGSHLHFEFHKPKGTRYNPCPSFKVNDQIKGWFNDNWKSFR